MIDLERLFTVRTGLDTGYIDGWLRKIAPPGDRRHALLADLIARFGPARGATPRS